MAISPSSSRISLTRGNCCFRTDNCLLGLPALYFKATSISHWLSLAVLVLPFSFLIFLLSLHFLPSTCLPGYFVQAPPSSCPCSHNCQLLPAAPPCAGPSRKFVTQFSSTCILHFELFRSPSAGSRAAAAPDRKWRGAAAGFVAVDEATLRENEAWAGQQQHLHYGPARC